MPPVHYSIDYTDVIKRRAMPDAKLVHVGLVLRPRVEESVQCATAEVCASIQGSPFCYNAATGDFHDAEGTTGNLITGDYVLADGRRGNIYNGPTPVPTGTEAGAATTPATSSQAAAKAAAPTTAATTGAAETATTGAASSAAQASAGATAASTTSAKSGANAARNGDLKSALGGMLLLLCARLL